MRILKLVTDNNPFLYQLKEEKDRRNYFMKYGTWPDSNWRSLDLQSDSLPTADCPKGTDK